VTDVPTPERWLPIPGHEGAYEVSDHGRARSLDRVTIGRDGRRYRRRGIGLSPTVNGQGYPIVSLPDGEARSGFRCRTVHSLVTAAFRGPMPVGMEVRHLNGTRTDCHLGNLVYGTQVENEADKRRHGTHEKTRRTICPLGHLLVAPNLVVGALKRGHRNCMACARGRSTVSHAAKRGVVLDLEVEAERHYRVIMKL